nr:MAG TPA: hypothetical protein [Caudoviricetes sp.]
MFRLNNEIAIYYSLVRYYSISDTNVNLKFQ